MSAAEWIEGAGGGGKGGGGSQRTPQEAPNTLRSTSKARIIDALGEGEIVGLANGLKSVYLDDTPLQDENGAFNFQGVTVHTRTGEPDQTHIPGFPAVETANDVSTEVTQGAPIVRTVGNLDADAVRVTVQLPALNEQNTSNGDLVGASVEVAIDVRPMGGTWAERKRDTIAGKTTSPYQRTYRIELTGSGPWDVRVRRITPDSDAATLNNATYWATYTEVIDAKLSYPDTALVALEVDAQQFGNQIPARSYDVKGLIIRVPDNYDPATRSYSGFWGGNFKLAWSDNPAWCYYDLATKTRYGAALANVDKWALYQIGQYCDELVPDGFGGEEPRFTFNTVLASQKEAITALHTLASAFRGMTYWGTNTVMPVADMPADPVKLVTPANVIDGEFVYEGTGLKARHSVAMVSYNDPNDNYRQQVEVVEDAEAIELYGWRPLEINAVACTSRGQAHRLGKWTLASERAETETVSYRASLDHADVRPGDIISVSDPTTAGARLGGRIVATGTEALTLDNVPEQASGANWFLDVMLPSGAVERRAVASFNGDEVALANPLSAPPIVGAVWILSSQAVEPRRFRVLANIEEAARVYHITALEHDPTKYGRIELGLDLPEPDYSLLPTGPVVAPYSLTAQAFTYLAGGTEHQGMTISWTPSDDPRVLRYIVEVQGPSDLRWRTVYTESGTSVDLRDVEPGQWMIRVRGVTGIGTASPWAALTTNIAGLLLPVPPDSVDIEVGTFTITLRPRGAYPGQMFEFWRSNVALALNQITSNAVRLTVSTDLTDTELSPGTTYYYYVRGANAYGVSSWYPVQATTDTTPEKLLQALSDSIRESELDQALQQRIDKIDGPETLPGSVAQRIAAEAEQRSEEVETVRGELVDGFEAEALARTQAIQQETDNRTVAITQLSEQVETEFGLLGLEINAIAAAYDATAASIYTMTQIRINEAEVVATQINQLSGRVEDNESLILDERQIRTNQYSSLATQVGILSARLDARPSLNSGFEPGADFDAWSATSGNAISAVTSGVYSGLQSALVTSTTASANPNNGGVRRIIAPETAAEFAGHEIRLAVYAKQPATGAAAEFAMAYQIAGQSVQWQRFTPTAEWAFYDVVIDVPEVTGGAQHAVAIWGSTAGGGNGVQVDRLLVTFAETDIPEVTAAIEQIQQALVDQQQAVAQELSGFETQLNSNTSAIQQEITARTTLTDSFATSIQTLQTQTQNNAAAIIAERDAWSSETDALAQQIEQLVADLGDGGAASLEEERQVRASEDEYLASLQRVLAAAEGVSSAAYQFQTTTRITAEEAEARRNEQLQAQIGDTQAAIQNEATVRANADSAQASQISALQSAASGNAASIQQEANTRASADSALSQQINTVQAAFDDELASVQQATQAQYNQTTQRLEAMWTLRIDNGGRVSGIGLGDDGEESLLGFRADRIYFAHPNSGDEVFPMVLDGGSVVMNDALINKLLFTKLRSSDDSLVFQNGKLQAEYIAVDDLVVRQGQSSNYLVGQRGWRLTTTGGEINFPIQFNNVQGAGALAGLDSVGYGDLTGAKPPTNADHTGSNTAFDTSRVAGTAASTVRDRANAGNNANNRVNNWTRPDSTLIDGNKIFTGDAYVDTLQIKGQAVTIPLSAYTGGAMVVGSEGGNNDVGGYRDYKDIQNLWVPSLPGTTEILCSFRVVFQISDGIGYPEVRLVEWNSSNMTVRYQSRIDPGLNTFAVVIPPRPNGRAFVLQLRFGSNGARNPGGLQFHASNRLIRTLTLKDNR
ncbi:putative tail protein [Halomonas phage vB_HmeY_H4907]|nr:putative tail protein [Halomonas phage vB_HmeY_H4907]